jgi:hypothetical protein
MDAFTFVTYFLINPPAEGKIQVSPGYLLGIAEDVFCIGISIQGSGL